MVMVAITNAVRGLSDVVNRARYARERIVLVRHGSPVAAVVSMQDLETLEGLELSAEEKDARCSPASAQPTP